jgi:hypothetical protein
VYQSRLGRSIKAYNRRVQRRAIGSPPGSDLLPVSPGPVGPVAQDAKHKKGAALPQGATPKRETRTGWLRFRQTADQKMGRTAHDRTGSTVETASNVGPEAPSQRAST